MAVITVKDRIVAIDRTRYPVRKELLLDGPRHPRESLGLNPKQVGIPG